MLNVDAFFSDGTKDYRMPCEPSPYDIVTIRFRAGKEDIDSVRLVTDEGFWQMVVKESDSLFDYYEIEFEITDQRISYYFEIYGDDKIWYYNRTGVALELHKEFNFMITPGFHTPGWAKGAVFYQIFVDRFYNGDVNNDVVDGEYSYINIPTRKVTDWNKYPDSFGVGEFYGGDLQGVIKKLDYLQELGVEAIYFNPIFVSPSNHKYDTQDYDFIDPHYGVIKNDGGEALVPNETNNRQATKYRFRVTDSENLHSSNDLLIQLVNEAHKRGLKVILDGVFNHCGSFHKWLDREGIYENADGYEKGAYADKNSPYTSFFRFREDHWPDNASYDGWWGHDTLPKLNYEGSPMLYNYVMDVAKKWVSPPFNCDGWRLDVAADLGYSAEFNHQFWKDFRRSVKEANPDAIIFAEHYGDPKSWLLGDEWDTVMNYDAFMEPLTWFLTGMEKHSDEFRESLLNRHDIFFQAMSYHMSRYQTSSLFTAMNELSNHDHSRFLTRTNKKVGRTASLGPHAAEEGINRGVLRSAVAIQMTWVGAPTIYYGDEAGVCGFTDPDNRRTFPWGNEDMDLIDFHKEIISIHKDYEALRTGSILFLGGTYGFISYGRFNRVDKFIIAVNNNNYEITETIKTWEVGISDEDTLCRLLLTTEEGYYRDAVIFHTENGMLQLNMPPISSIIVKNVVQNKKI